MQAWQYRGAADLLVPPAERASSLRRESGLVASVCHQLWWFCVRVYLRVFHRVSIEGLENLPRRLPFVIVANHTSHLDTLVLAAFLPARLRDRIFPVAAGDAFFESRAMKFFAALCLNALPLWRKRVCSKQLAELRMRLLSEPCGYILFPEGTRTRDGELAEFKPGLGMLVAGTAVSVIPCRIDGAFEAMPPHSRFPRPRRIRLRVGTPLQFEATRDEREGWAEVARRAHAGVAALAS